ncbi:MAG: hypothetical protein HOP00_05930 [Nitrospira sp.]|nr:hypothetical protein [Nitrospira sp.]
MLKWSSTTIIGCAVVLMNLSVAVANPAMLPKHPGHPMAPGSDPVTGQALTHDAGQLMNQKDHALQEAARYHDKESVQRLQPDPTIESQGAGRLPKIQGYPGYKIEPPVTEAIDPSKVSSSELSSR